jgi:hypothetical protein
MHPTGPGGFTVLGQRGVIQQTGAARTRFATLDTRSRDTSVEVTFGLGGSSTGPAPKAIVVARKSAAGEYRFGVRVGEGGKVRLSMARVRAGRAVKGLGSQVTISGWRYRSGSRIKVLAQVIQRDPTQLRMKVWRAGTAAPSGWQMVRNDAGADITSAGRVGLMSLPAGTPKPKVALHFDDVVVRDVAGAKRVPTGSGGDAAPKPDGGGDPAPKSDPAPKDVVMIPASIDATGQRDVSAQLQTFIRNAPNGSTLRFKAGGTYRLNKAIRINRKSGLTFDGNAATIKLTGPGSYWGSAFFVDQGSKNTTIRDLKIVGNHAKAGTKGTCCGREGQHGIGIHGSTNTVIERVDISRVGGDCFNIKDFSGDKVLAKGVTIRNSTCRLNGRMGVVINGARDVRIVNNRFDQLGYAVVGMEPNKPHQGADGVLIKDNTVGTYSLNGQYRGYLLFACDAPWMQGRSTIQNVTLTGNTVAGNRNGRTNTMLGLNVRICGERGIRRNFTITDNTASKAAPGPVMRFQDVNGVTVKRNKQPLSSGALATFPGSSDVDYVR